MQEAERTLSREEAQEALDEVQRVRKTNEQRLRKPGRYWIMVGGFLGVLALIPLSRDYLTEPWTYLAPPALLIVIAAACMWGQPVAGRQYRMTRPMAVQLVRFLLILCVLTSVGPGLYGAFEHWWIPVLFAFAMFGTSAVLGSRMDRDWAKVVSRGN